MPIDHLTQLDELTDDDESTLLDELREVAHIYEEEKTIVVFASPAETSAIGIEMIKIFGGWLLDRRRQKRVARSSSATPGTQSTFSASPDSMAVS